MSLLRARVEGGWWGAAVPDGLESPGWGQGHAACHQCSLAPFPDFWGLLPPILVPGPDLRIPPLPALPPAQRIQSIQRKAVWAGRGGGGERGPERPGMASAELRSGSACGPEGDDKIRGEAHFQPAGKQLRTTPSLLAHTNNERPCHSVNHTSTKL